MSTKNTVLLLLIKIFLVLKEGTLLRDVFFGDFSQVKKLSEIKPPLEVLTKIFIFLNCTTSTLEKVSLIHETYLLDMFCWRHFSKTEVVQNTDVNILAL